MALVFKNCCLKNGRFRNTDRHEVALQNFRLVLVRKSHNPFPGKSKEEERLRVQVLKAKQSGHRLFSTFERGQFYSKPHSFNGAVALLPLILIVVLLASPFIYMRWAFRQMKTYPQSRKSFIKSEMRRWTWIFSMLAAAYATVDSLFLKNHVYLSMAAIPLSIWMMRKLYKQSRASARKVEYENRKWEGRRRRKLAKQQAREQKQVV